MVFVVKCSLLTLSHPLMLVAMMRALVNYDLLLCGMNGLSGD